MPGLTVRGRVMTCNWTTIHLQSDALEHCNWTDEDSRSDGAGPSFGPTLVHRRPAEADRMGFVARCPSESCWTRCIACRVYSPPRNWRSIAAASLAVSSSRDRTMRCGFPRSQTRWRDACRLSGSIRSRNVCWRPDRSAPPDRRRSRVFSTRCLPRIRDASERTAGGPIWRADRGWRVPGGPGAPCGSAADVLVSRLRAGRSWRLRRFIRSICWRRELWCMVGARSGCSARQRRIDAVRAGDARCTSLDAP